jgi:hypothetical protein
MLFWLWLLGRFSLDLDLTSWRDPFITFLLFNTISVLMNTLEMYAELRPRMPKAAFSIFCGATGISLQNLFRAASMPFFWISISHSDDGDDDDLWNSTRIAITVR